MDELNIDKAVDELLAEMSAEICAHSAMDGAGTKSTGYALPEMGPFKCANCIHAGDDATRCDHPKVIADEDVPKAPDQKKAIVHPEACCNYFHPKDEGEIEAYGTSEGAVKGWDTRGRGRKKEEEMYEQTYKRGTTTLGLDRILKEGEVKQNPHPISLERDSFFFENRITSPKGYVHLTYQDEIAKKYAIFKTAFAKAEPGELISGGDPDKEEFIGMSKPKDGPPAVKGEVLPAVMTFKLPMAMAKKMEDDPDSPPSSDSFKYKGTIPLKYLTGVKVRYPGQGWKPWTKWKSAIKAEGEGDTVEVYVPYAGSEDALEKELQEWAKEHLDVEAAIEELLAETLFRGVRIEGFSTPDEEIVRACISRIPPELLTNVERVVTAPELFPKHGKYDPATKTVHLSPYIFTLRQRFGKGQGWLLHFELTVVHEFMHAVYTYLPEDKKDEWRELSGWMRGTQPGQAPAYVERRPGWEPTTSNWTHKYGVKFPRRYSERNDDEDFADCAAFYLLGKAHQIGKNKRAFLDGLFKGMVKRYPQYSIESPEKAYGEREVQAGGPGSGCHGDNCGRPVSSHVYHATSNENLEKIKRDGYLRPNVGQYGKHIYFTDSHDKALSSEARAIDAVIRLKRSDLPSDYDEFPDQGYTADKIPISKLQYSRDGRVWYNFPTKIKAGGPGSGCNPEVAEPRCGRPSDGISGGGITEATKKDADELDAWTDDVRLGKIRKSTVELRKADAADVALSIAERLDDGRAKKVFVLREGGKILGAMELVWPSKFGLKENEADVHMVEVKYLATNPKVISGEIQAKGVGTRLLLHAAKYAAEHDAGIELLALSGAASFYEKLGMSKEGNLAYYWTKNETKAFAEYGRVVHAAEGKPTKEEVERRVKEAMEEEKRTPALAGKKEKKVDTKN